MSRSLDRLTYRVFATGGSLAIFPIRVAFGVLFFAHGAQKLFGLFGGPGLAAAGRAFQAMGFSPGRPMALLAGLIEFGGGLLLLVGFGTRLAASLLAVEMLIAMLAVHAKNGFFLNMMCTPGHGHGIEFTLALTAGLLAAAFYGGGAGSIDRSLTTRR